MADLIIGNKTNQSSYTLLLDANLKTTNENNQEIDLVELIPAWARATQKPSYTASEVGAVPTSRTVNGKALSSNITLGANNITFTSTTDISATNVQTAIVEVLSDAKTYVDNAIGLAIEGAY